MHFKLRGRGWCYCILVLVVPWKLSTNFWKWRFLAENLIHSSVAFWHLLWVDSTIAGSSLISWVLHGYVKGDSILDSSHSYICWTWACFLITDRAVVLTALWRNIQESGSLKSYSKLCKWLFETNLTGPCLIYLYMSAKSNFGWCTYRNLML
jgi:hypothetical protein